LYISPPAILLSYGYFLLPRRFSHSCETRPVSALCSYLSTHPGASRRALLSPLYTDSTSSLTSHSIPLSFICLSFSYTPRLLVHCNPKTFENTYFHLLVCLRSAISPNMLRKLMFSKNSLHLKTPGSHCRANTERASYHAIHLSQTWPLHFHLPAVFL